MVVAEADLHEEVLHSEDDDQVDLAEVRAEDLRDEAEDGSLARTSISLDLSTRQS